MNISNIPISYNITNKITTGAPQAGFRCDPSKSVPITNGTDPSNIATLKNLNYFSCQGYREDYSIRDAADYLWRQETQTFNLKDLEDPEKSKEILENLRIQARWDLGIQGPGPTKEEVLNDYIQGLRQNGLGGEIDWSSLSRELDAFKTAGPDELEDGLNYLASRYVAALDKLERNCTGEELSTQRAKLEETYEAGKAKMINNYAQVLQDNLGISVSDAQAVRDSFSAILAEKVDSYRGALDRVHESISQTGADSVWLKNHDGYIASQLRSAGGASQSKAGAALYSVQDLAAAGKLAQAYQSEISMVSHSGGSEYTLALNLSMADMKAEALIEKGLVSKNMAALLRSSRAQGHEKALAAADQALARRESHRLSGEPKGTFAPVDRTVFQSIYNAVMNTYRQNGGDAAGAIRAGVTAGQTATRQASARNPHALRWGISSEHYWKEFYTTPPKRASNPLRQEFDKLFHQIGLPDRSRNSTYQNYVNDWQRFLTSIGSGVDTRA